MSEDSEWLAWAATSGNARPHPSGPRNVLHNVYPRPFTAGWNIQPGQDCDVYGWRMRLVYEDSGHTEFDALEIPGSAPATDHWESAWIIAMSLRDIIASDLRLPARPTDQELLEQAGETNPPCEEELAEINRLNSEVNVAKRDDK